MKSTNPLRARTWTSTRARTPCTRLAFGGLALACALLSACGKSVDAAATASVSASASAPAPAASGSPPLEPSFYGTSFERQPTPAELTELGRRLFHETALSSSGRASCASCHDPAHAYGPPNGLAVQFGGEDLKRPGLRAVPSLRYQQDTPPFSQHFSDTDGNDSEDQGPTGGRDWDGRASSAHEQAAGPLLSSFEMGNATPDAATRRLAASSSAGAFKAAFGPHVFDTPGHAWKGLLLALEVFQQSPADFYPYDSKYDEYLRGQAALSPAEQRGLALFNDPGKGNCASCHISAVRRGAFPQFTDRGLIALAVPRNMKIPANADPQYRDLGLCGPLRTDLKDHPEYCGLFKTPSLRNVASRQVFFHNGAYHRLEDAVRFYMERDTRPQKIYGRGPDGKVRMFDDLPQPYRANVNTDPPFGGKPGEAPALTPTEIQDVTAFLRTLSDHDVAARAASAR